MTYLKMNKRELLVKSLISIAGLFIMAQGVSIYLMLDLGVDPISVFLDGLTEHFPITFGQAQTIVNFAILVIPILFFRKYIGPSTLFALFLMGPFFDLILSAESAVLYSELSLVAKLPLMVVAQICFSFGVALYLSVNMGGSPCDSPGVIISKVKGWTYGKVRVVSDATFFLIGLALGGTVGAGTIMCVLFTGPISQHFSPFCKTIVDKLAIPVNKGPQV